jgi:hypothetical protein
VVTFYTEGAPHDAGLPLRSQAERLRSALAPYCTRFLAFTLREVRSMKLQDGTRCSRLARDLRGHLAHANGGVPPNLGYAAIGFGAARPCFMLAVLEQMQDGSVLYYVDVNVAKHWNLAAFPHHAERTARWLLAHAAVSRHAFDGVVMPCENSVLQMRHICSRKALRAAEERCGGKPLAHLPSTHSNRFVALAGAPARRALRAWMAAGERLDELLPSEMSDRHRWHTPEQCLFGLLDACRNGASEVGNVWFDWFFTRMHARPCDELGGGGRRRRGLNLSEELPVFQSRLATLPQRFEDSSRHGIVLQALARDAPAQDDVLDACLAFPRALVGCPGLYYRHVSVGSARWNTSNLDGVRRVGFWELAVQRRVPVAGTAHSRRLQYRYIDG